MAIIRIATWAVFLKSAFFSLLLSWLLPPSVTVLALQCYTCNRVSHPGECTVVSTCQPDQLCSAVHNTAGGFYTTGCKNTKACTSIEGYPSFVGRRQAARSSADDCSDCCTDSKCNVEAPVCSTPAPDCGDKLAECSQKVFRDAICTNQYQAKAICQKSCGLCPIAGGWSHWGQYSRCSVTCGVGSRTRIRLCNNPPPSHNGPGCSGPNRDTATCNPGVCPVDGHWSTWSHWSRCSATCGGGYSIRVRNCNNPPPGHGGNPCPDAANFRQTQQCNTATCMVDGHWSPWSPWSHCSATCGSGFSMRVRNCNDPLPQNGGRPCPDAAHFRETQPCHVTSCPVNGHWSSWSSWSHCSATCGSGFSIRVRNCNNPLPANGGNPCPDAANFRQTKTCSTHSCNAPTTSGTHTTNHVFTNAPTSTSLKTAMTSRLTPPPPTAAACHDHAFCDDPHVKPVACSDPYIANTYCQKLCGICGATHSQPPCTDQSGPRCTDTLYLHFVCNDRDLSILCSKACDLCQ